MARANQFNMAELFIATTVLAVGIGLLVGVGKPVTWVDEGDIYTAVAVAFLAVVTPLLATFALFGRFRFWLPILLGSLAFVAYYLSGIPVE